MESCTFCNIVRTLCANECAIQVVHNFCTFQTKIPYLFIKLSRLIVNLSCTLHCVKHINVLAAGGDFYALLSMSVCSTTMYHV